MRRLAALLVFAVLGLAPQAALAQGGVACGDYDRDHVWVVDQNGDEVSIEGCWRLVHATHPRSSHKIEQVNEFPPPPGVVEEFCDAGTYTDPHGRMWTRVNVRLGADNRLYFLERVDTSFEVDKWYVLARTAEDGSVLTEYANDDDMDFAVPGTDLMIWERTDCD